jgi:hypothetical protein
MRRPNLAIMLALGGALIPSRSVLIRDHSDGDHFPILTAPDDCDTTHGSTPRRRSNAASIKRQAAKARNVRKRSRK